MFYQLSGHPLAQSSWHIKVTITWPSFPDPLVQVSTRRFHWAVPEALQIHRVPIILLTSAPKLALSIPCNTQGKVSHHLRHLARLPRPLGRPLMHFSGWLLGVSLLLSSSRPGFMACNRLAASPGSTVPPPHSHGRAQQESSPHSHSPEGSQGRGTSNGCYGMGIRGSTGWRGPFIPSASWLLRTWDQHHAHRVPLSW